MLAMCRASLAVSEAATISVSHVDKAIVGCFFTSPGDSSGVVVENIASSGVFNVPI